MDRTVYQEKSQAGLDGSSASVPPGMSTPVRTESEHTAYEQIATRPADGSDLEKKSTSQVDITDVPDFPDGGWRAWTTVAGVWLMQYSTFGYTNAHGVYTDFYVRQYLSNYSSSQISWIGSMQFGITMSSGLITGRLFDAGYFYHMVYGGAAIVTFCLFMLSLAQPQQFYQVFLAQGVGLGIGIGLSYIPTVSVVSQYFHKRRALALGIATSGSAVGGMIHPVLLNKLIFGRLGYAGAVKVSAAANAGTMIVGLLLMRARYPMGGKSARRNGRGGPGLWVNMRKFYKEPTFCFTSAGTVFTLLGLYLPIFFLQLKAIQNGVDPDLAFYSLTILNGANALGRIIPNMLVPVVGPFNVMLPTSLGCCVLIFAMAGVKSAGGVIAFSILFGFFSGSYIGLLAPLVSTLAENTSEIGARVGICLSFTGFGALFGSPIQGALLGSDFVWIRSILFAGMIVAVGGVCFSTARTLLARKRGTWRI